MHGVELFHKFSARILQKSRSVRTDSVDQDQTAQNVQSDVGFTLSVNLWDIYFVKTINMKWQYSGFNNMSNFFFSRLWIKFNYKSTRCNS